MVSQLCVMLTDVKSTLIKVKVMTDVVVMLFLTTDVWQMFIAMW